MRKVKDFDDPAGLDIGGGLSHVRRDCLATPDEGQRLVRAFLQIRDPAVREELLRLVERIATK